MAALNVSSAMAMHQPYNPWELPPTFTVFELAPEQVRQFLHPHWQTQKAVHPIYAYFFGLYYFVMGEPVDRSLVNGLFVRFLCRCVGHRWKCRRTEDFQPVPRPAHPVKHARHKSCSIRFAAHDFPHPRIGYQLLSWRGVAIRQPWMSNSRILR